MKGTTTAATARVHDGPATARLVKGFGWGVVATVAMSIPMILGMLSGVAPMPQPIPVALVATVLGGDLPRPVLMLLGALSHLLYGGFWGAVLAGNTRPVTVGKGVLLGIALWLLMQVAFLPFLGWGLFGTAITTAIAGATLALHLIYGATLGGLMDRRRPATHEAST